MMTKTIRWMVVAVAAAVLTVGSTAWAGECCAKAAVATKAGKTCAACETTECCKAAAKEAAKQVAKTGADAKPCEKCAAKAEAKAKETA